MSLFDCIDSAVRAGLMDKDRASAAQRLTRELEAQYGAIMDAAAAAAQAAKDVKAVFREETLARRQHVLDTVRSQRRLAEWMDGYVDIYGKDEPSTALNALLEYDQAAEFESVRGVREAYRMRYHRIIADFLGRFQKDALARVRNKAELPAVVRELFGEGSGDPAARELAQAILAAFEQARLDFNAAGGRIGKLQDFGLPHRHDAARIRAKGFDAWADEILQRLDWGRIQDFKTGKPFTASAQPRRRAFLREIYDDITTDGLAKREPSGRAPGRALYARRADHRLLHFRSADDWLAYNEAFGVADPFSTIVAHLDGMARDTALMRVLGPNPRAGLEFATQHLTKRAKERPWKVGGVAGAVGRTAEDRVKTQGAFARVMLGQMMGEYNHGGNRFWALIGGTVRVGLVPAQLGSAMLSAVSDVVFGGMAARHLGIGALRPLRRQLRMMASSDMRAEALRLGVVADMAANAGVAASRYMLDSTPMAVADRMADSALRLSLLTQWTELGRHVATLEQYAFMAEMAPKAWDDLPDPFRRLFLQRRGFTPDDWEAIRATPLHTTQDGAIMLIPDMIREAAHLPPERADSLAIRLSAAVLEQVEFAVPSSTLRGRANLLGNTPPGTPYGEVMRSIGGYRGFAMTLMVNNLRRVLLADTRDPRLVAMLGFAALTTFAGALSLQLKEVSKGRDPQPMDTPAFWGRAALQGGGLGILGDFITASENRFGGGLPATMGGPVVAFSEDMLNFTVGNIRQLIAGDDTNAGRELVQLLRQYTPFGNLWYLSIAFQRLGMDTLQKALDPEAERSWRRRERRRRKDYGNDAWWRPGDPAPRRAPDVSTIAGD